MPPQQVIQRQTLPELREKLAEQFQPGRKQRHQTMQNQRNFIVFLIVSIKNSIQNAVAFVFTVALLVPLWLFKIGLHALDTFQRAIRFIVWFYVKIIVFGINMIYRILAFLRITSAVKFVKNWVKYFFGTYSTDSIDEEQSKVSRLQFITNKKQHDLIDVKKVQKKIKTPNIFIVHEEDKKKPEEGQQTKEEYVQRVNMNLVPERTVHENIVQTQHRIKSPHILEMSESHLRLKRTSTQPIILSPLARRQAPIMFNQQYASQSTRIQPDRDTSPSYNKLQEQRTNLTYSQSSFKKKDSPQREILLTHHHPITSGSVSQKQQLERQLQTLRQKMCELITDNNRDIQQLQEWIREKSQTIMMSRKQNLELLEQIQELQRENVEKTKKFTQFEQKIKDMEISLEKERNIKNGLNEQVQKLEEEIKVKTIQIMSLKAKIRNNFQHLQEMENIFGPEKFQLQRQAQKDDQILYIKKSSQKDEEHSVAKSLQNDLPIKEQPNQIEPFTILPPEYELVSNIETKGSTFVNQEQDLESPFKRPLQTESEKGEVQKLQVDDANDDLSLNANVPLLAEEFTQTQQNKEKVQEQVEKTIQTIEFQIQCTTWEQTKTLEPQQNIQDNKQVKNEDQEVGQEQGGQKKKKRKHKKTRK